MTDSYSRRNDAVFHTNTWDAEEVWYQEGEVFSVLRAGEMKALYRNEQGEIDFLRYTSDFDERGIDSDGKLYDAICLPPESIGSIEWDNNPWFEVAKENDTEDYGVYSDLEEAINRAKELIEEDHEESN